MDRFPTPALRRDTSPIYKSNCTQALHVLKNEVEVKLQ